MLCHILFLVESIGLKQTLLPALNECLFTLFLNFPCALILVQFNSFGAVRDGEILCCVQIAPSLHFAGIPHLLKICRIDAALYKNLPKAAAIGLAGLGKARYNRERQ
ncbi:MULTISPECIES: hypothetical protein [unclassified Acinetobacter]|uniref:hypothetical protein n=1 Tax=unclassified Acinetobacter TaxID=196816 RepID=UPI0015D33AC3|nr:MULTISPECIES: hypothetical protein [unclassified Acinetobacter]